MLEGCFHLRFGNRLFYTDFYYLGKAYDITYVRLKFQSPRPASFAIYKKDRKKPSELDDKPDDGWIPWQYYSATCRDTYKMPDSPYVIQV
jgi:laminin gamma 1